MIYKQAVTSVQRNIRNSHSLLLKPAFRCFGQYDFQEEYIPSRPLKFSKDGLYTLYSASQETQKLKLYLHYPTPVMLSCLGLTIYNSIYLSVYWSFPLIIPFALAFSFRKSALDNMEVTIQNIYLEENGAYIQVESMSNKIKKHPIASLRKSTDEELEKIWEEGGEHFQQRMKHHDFLMVQAARQSKENGKLVYDAGVIDVLMIDQNAQISDQLVINAVFRGAAIKKR